MAKKDRGYKIRRKSGHIYRRDRNSTRTPGGVFGTVVVILLLFVAGWFLYPPIYELITHQPEGKPSELSSASEESSEEESSQAPAQEPAAPETPASLQMVYVPPQLMTQPEQLQLLLQSAGSTGCNAVLFDVKTDDGTVLYQTENETAVSSGAVSEDAVDLSAFCQSIQDYGMVPVARLHTFQDHIASRRNLELAVHYRDEDALWLDDYYDEGGQSWLNPYSAQAQDYNIALALECVENGARMVVADSVQFPNAVGVNLASYGDTGEVGKEQVLFDFVERMQQAVQKAGAAFAVATLSTALVPDPPMDYLGLPAEYPCPLVVNAMPSFLASSDAEQWPLDEPYRVMLEALQAASEATHQALIPYIQCYTDGEDGQAVGRESVQAQLDAIRELQLESYIFYDPQGAYEPFSASGSAE